jgi:hypothetical protein
MSRFGRLHHRRTYRAKGKLHPLAIVGICLAGAILLALIVGNLLNHRLSDEDYQKLTSGTVTEPIDPTTVTPQRQSPQVKAYPFALGDSVRGLTDGEALPPSALSVNLNMPSGALLYSSPVSKLYSLSGSTTVSLPDSMQEIIGTVPYICGVFHPHATEQSGADLIYAATVREAALLREFAGAGGSEILLVGLKFDIEHLSDTLAYIKMIRDAVGNIPVGVAIDFETVSSPETWDLLPVLGNAASFLALDLTQEEANEEILLSANYYLMTYRMRLVLAENQTALITAAEATVSDFQILKN